MRNRLWLALAANAILASSCSSPETIVPNAEPGAGPGSGPGAGPTVPVHAVVYEHEIHGGRLHDMAVTGINAVTADPAKLVDAVQSDLRGRLGTVHAADFVEVHRYTEAARAGSRLQFVTLRQTIGGVPIDDTYLHAGLQLGPRGTRLVSSSYRLFENVSLDTQPAIARDRAEALAQQSLRLHTPTAATVGSLVVHQLDGHLQLAWSFVFEGSYKRAFVIASGVQQGRVIAIDRRVYETTGSISGPVVRGGAPGGLGTIETHAFPNVRVDGGGVQTFAGGTGSYAISVPSGTPLTASLSGKASNLVDQLGSPVTATGIAIDGGVTNLAFATTSEPGLAQVTAYFIVDQVRGFLEQNGMDPVLFGPPLTTRANLNDTCNAFYDPGDISINFFRSGGGCNNSAIDTVIAHEYGHFVDDFNGGIFDGGLSEGWGDLLACLWSQQPVVGFDLLPGNSIRSCENDYVFPPGGFDEVHNLGQAWAGFGWDVRQNLIAQLGPAGDDLARALLLPSFQSNAPDIPSAVREVFLRDDDDGDLSNLTPHWDALFPAAVHHALDFTVVPDSTAPAPVTDLAFTTVLPTEVVVRWSATGDDGNAGNAAAYELRWSTAPIDASNFPAGTLIPTGTPKSPGSFETASFSVPPQTPVFVAIVVSDDDGNVSTLSNVISATTPGGEEVFAESFEGDISGWTTTGLWHLTTRRAADGSHALWYGKEDTGDYNTPGLPNHGDLVSPVIDLSSAINPTLIYDQFVRTETDPFDLTQVLVTDVDDPANTQIFDKVTSFTAEFEPRVIALPSFQGKRIQLTFHFDTLDSFENTREGWYVDHLRILGFATCEHDTCAVGGPLEPTCSTCAAQVCAFDPECCTVAWTATCVEESEALCGNTCSACGNGTCEPGETQTSCPQDCTPPCAHEVCDPGAALDQTCNTCAGTVCGADPFCCEVFWDRVCVQESESLCGEACQGCGHDFCVAGEPLAGDCDPCATSVCATDPYCCTTGWDSRCVQESADTCNLTCTVCSHSLCSQGTPLETSCDPCAGSVCAADPYCCNNTWDQRCIDEAQTTCGLSCITERTASSPLPPVERAR